MREMFMLSVRFLTGQKCFLRILLVTMILSAGILYGTGSVLEAVNQEKLEQTAADTGFHHGILYDLSEEQIHQLSVKEDTPANGFTTGFVTVGKKRDITVYSGKMNEECRRNELSGITGGFMDFSFRKIGCITFVEGHYPEVEDEVALESYIAKQCGDIHVNQTITVKTGENEKDFRVSGIIRNYSNVWTTLSEEDGTLPQLLYSDSSAVYVAAEENTEGGNTAASSVAGNNVAVDALVRFDGESMSDSAVRKFYQLAQELGIDTSTANDRLIHSDACTEIFHMALMKKIFAVCLIFSVFGILYNLYEIYYIRFSADMRVIFYLGASVSKVGMLVVIQQMILLLAGMAAGAGAGVCIQWVMLGLMNLKYSLSLSEILISLGMIALEVVVNTVILYRKIVRNMGTHEKSGSHVITSGKRKRKKERYKKFSSASFMVGYNNFLLYHRSFTGSILAFGICSAVFCFGIQYSRELKEYPVQNPNGYTCFELSAQEQKTSVNYAGYDMYLNSDQCISYSEYKNICGLTGVSLVRGEPYTGGICLELTKAEWESSGDRFLCETIDQDLLTDNGITARADYIVKNLEFYVLDEKDFPLFREQLKDERIQNPEYSSLAVLYVPGKETGFNPEKCCLGVMKKNNPEDRIEVEKLQNYRADYRQISLILSACINDRFSFGEFTENDQPDLPVLVVSQELAERAELFPGYESVEVCVDSQNRDRVEEYLNRIAANSPNSSVFCASDYWKRMSALGADMEKMTWMCCFCLAVFGIFLSGMCFYSRILTQKEQLGMYQVMGLQKKSLMFSIMIENALYFIFTALFSAAVLIGLSLLMGWDIYFLQYIDEYVLILAALLGISQLGLVFPIFRLLKKDLAEMIVYRE